MKTEYEYIWFDAISLPGEDGRKTGVWQCLAIEGNARLGLVKWYPSWRKYCFFPERETVFHGGCLLDINDFIRQLMDARKK